MLAFPGVPSGKMECQNWCFDVSILFIGIRPQNGLLLHILGHTVGLQFILPWKNQCGKNKTSHFYAPLDLFAGDQHKRCWWALTPTTTGFAMNFPLQHHKHWIYSPHFKPQIVMSTVYSKTHKQMTFIVNTEQARPTFYTKPWFQDHFSAMCEIWIP